MNTLRPCISATTAVAAVAMLLAAAPAQAQDALALFDLDETTTADFLAGTPAGTMVSEADSSAASGSLRLAAPFYDLFAADTLDAQWTVTNPGSGYSPVIAGGVLDVQERDDTNYELSTLHSDTTFTAGVVFEARAMFTPGSAFVNIGLMTESTSSSDEWAYFSFRGTGNSAFPIIHASTRDSSGIRVSEPTTTTVDQWHDFRIVWLPDSLAFYVDDELVDTRSGTGFLTPQRVALYKSQGSESPFLVDWVRVTPYVGSPGTFTSQVLDAGAVAEWQTATWTGETPVGTSVAFETRTGPTAAPDTAWSAWEPVLGDLMSSPDGRYAQYRASLASSDLAVSPVVDAVSLLFFVADTTPPTVEDVSPNDLAVDVAVGTNVTARFSEPLDAATVDTASFTLAPTAGQPVAATVTWDSAATTATLTPQVSLAHDTTYEAVLDTAITDLDGNALAAPYVWSFTTEPPDLTPPTVTTTDPQDGAMDVLAGRPLRVVFDEAIDPATLTTASFTVAPRGGAPVAASVSWDGATLTATLTPADTLAWDTTHDARVTTAVTDLAGNPLAADEVWSFATRPHAPLCDVATTTADFRAGTLMTAMVGEVDSSATGGQLRLAAPLNDTFEDSTLSTKWNVTRPVGETWTPVIADGLLDVQERDSLDADVSALESDLTWGPGTVLEARAMFVPGSRFVDVGFCSSTLNNAEYAWFSTAGTGDQPGQEKIVARVRDFDHNTIGIDTDITFNEWHVFRIVWLIDRVEFWSDGVLKATHHGVVYSRPMRAAFFKSDDSETPFWIDWIRVTPYAGTSGGYDSPVVDAGAADMEWTDLTWQGDTPAGTGVAFETRTGPTASPDGTWSAWEPLADGLIASPAGRYAQYRATLTTNDLLVSPAVDEISICYAAPVDTTRPAVVATAPADGATAIAPDTLVTATFDEPVDPATLTTATFTLTPDGGSPVAATVGLDSAGTTATLTPDAVLAWETLYTAQLTTAVTDTAGNGLAADYLWSFTTAVEPDTTALAVVATEPADEATDVPVDTDVTATFDESADPATLTSASFTLTPDGGSPVAATVSLDSAGTTATLTPDAVLAWETMYTAQLTTAVTDTAGNGLAADYLWSFTTAVEPDTTGPAVIAVFPADQAADAPSDTTITATFDEPLDPATLTAASFTLAPAGGEPVAATVSWDTSANRAVLLPDRQLDGLTVYEARLTTALTDTAGNALAADHVWTFTTEDGPVSGVPALPTVTRLRQNAPNPFNPRTTIAFDLHRAGMVRLKIYAVNGRLVRTLVAERLERGVHQRVWDGRDDRGGQVATGVYLMRMDAAGVVQTRKMLLMK